MTATKRQESVQHVPISMEVVSGASLAKNNISQFQDLVNEIPGMTLQISPTVPTVSLRGFGTAANNPAYDQTVAIYQDGIFAGRARDFQVPFFDLARVEVLRGPQGSLLGKNSSAGAVNLISAMPTNDFSAGVNATYLFNRDGVDLNGFVSGPIGSDLTARLAFHVLDTTKGYVYNEATGKDDPTSRIGSARLSFHWTPTGAFDMVTRFEYSDMVNHGTTAASFPAGVPLDSEINWTRDVGGVFGQEDGLRLKPYQISNQANWKLGGYTLQSITGYQGFSAHSVAGGGAVTPETVGVFQGEVWSQASQEFRVLSPTDGPFEWVAGVYGDTSTYRTDFGLQYNVLGGLLAGRGDMYFHQKADTFSAYGTGTWKVTSALRVIAGFRYTYIKKTGDFDLEQTFGTPLGWTPGLKIDQSFSESHYDPQATVEYRFNDAAMVYAAYSQGSKGGAFQATNQAVTPAGFALKPEKAESYEVGLKSQPLSWITFNIDAFQLTVSNMQSGQYVGSPPALVNVNVGKARSQGVEWTLTLKPTSELTLSATGDYMHARYLDYPGAPCTYAQAQAGCIDGSVNAAGEDLPAQPRWSGTVSLDYHHPVSERFVFFFSTDVDFRSRADIDAGIENPLSGYQNAFAKVNGRIGVQTADGRWEAALVARNLFNKLTVNSSFPWNPPFVPATIIITRVDEARSIGLQLGWKY